MSLQEIGRYNTVLKAALLETTDRRGRPLTQRAAAKRARIEESKFSRIISGQAEPTPRERKAIARVVGKPVSELFPASEAVAS